MSNLKGLEINLTAGTSNGKGASDIIHIQDRRVARALRSLKHIAKPRQEICFCCRIGPDRQALAHIDNYHSQII